MMNKEMFLKELQDRLAVLEESERQDILAEYAQHIELRTAGGLTEEAAIQDFGDLDQLTAEILGAYHVDPYYGHPAERKHLPEIGPAIRSGVSGAGGALRSAGGKVAGWVRRAGAGLRRLGQRAAVLAKRGWERLRGLLTWRGRMAEETPKGEELMQMEQIEEQRPSRWRAAMKKAAAGAGWLFRNVARLVWDLALLVCAVPFVLLALAAVAGLGLLTVLLVQGYPLAGAVLCCLGGIAFSVGVLGLGSQLIWHRSAPETARQESEVEEDA